MVGDDRKDGDLFGVGAVAPKNAMGLGRIILSVRAKNLSPINGIEIFHGVGLEPGVIRIFGQMPKRFFDLLDQALARPTAFDLFDL